MKLEGRAEGEVEEDEVNEDVADEAVDAEDKRTAWPPATLTLASLLKLVVLPSPPMLKLLRCSDEGGPYETDGDAKCDAILRTRCNSSFPLWLPALLLLIVLEPVLSAAPSLPLLLTGMLKSPPALSPSRVSLLPMLKLAPSSSRVALLPMLKLDGRGKDEDDDDEIEVAGGAAARVSCGEA